LLEHDVEGAFWLFVIAAITDLLDGNLARWLNQRSVLGAWLDPIADKVMLLTTLSMLALTGLLPMWLLYVVVVRDLVILAGAEAYRRLTGKLDVHLLCPARSRLSWSLSWFPGCSPMSRSTWVCMDRSNRWRC
jgi:cardiolipin synthase (CMP-forming)